MVMIIVLWIYLDRDLLKIDSSWYLSYLTFFVNIF